jgi:hypothetical protein
MVIKKRNVEERQNSKRKEKDVKDTWEVSKEKEN